MIGLPMALRLCDVMPYSNFQAPRSIQSTYTAHVLDTHGFVPCFYGNECAALPLAILAIALLTTSLSSIRAIQAR
jgi:hypothetical protein